MKYDVATQSLLVGIFQRVVANNSGEEDIDWYKSIRTIYGGEFSDKFISKFIIISLFSI